MAEATINFGASGGFGDIAGWNHIDNSSPNSKDRATASDEIGNEAASNMHNERTEYSDSYETPLAGSAPNIPAEIGDIINSILLTRIRVETDGTSYAKMTLEGHQHADNPHTSEKTVAHGITLDDGFGVTDFLGGTAGANASCVRSDITIECEHLDETDGDGDHLVGENYNPRMTANSEWVGTPTEPNADSSWDIQSSSPTRGNTAYERVTYTGVKALEFSLS